jgi:2,3-dihydroxyphenylpropionate 1,2-dioxygenase
VGEVVIGVLASHTTLMNTAWDAVDHLPRAHDFRDALGAAGLAIEAAGADVAVIVGPNHFRGLWLDLMPTFTFGVGEVSGVGEHGTPAGPLPTDTSLAHALLSAAVDAGFDPAFSARLQVDHGITHAVQWMLPPGMPVVPVVVNCLAPPLARLDRCASLGAVLGAAIAAHGDRRVAMIGSGGLSHQLPFPDWRRPQSDDDEFLVGSWLDGRQRWAEFEPRRRGIVVAAPPRLAEEFDRDVLATLARGDGARLVEHQETLERVAGNGAAELRTWITAAAACGFAPARTLCYSAMPEWLTGMAVALVEPRSQHGSWPDLAENRAENRDADADIPRKAVKVQP